MPSKNKRILDFIKHQRVAGIKQQTVPDLDPRLAEARKNNVQIEAEKFICDCIEADLKEQNYVRHGVGFIITRRTSLK